MHCAFLPLWQPSEVECPPTCMTTSKLARSMLNFLNRFCFHCPLHYVSSQAKTTVTLGVLWRSGSGLAPNFASPTSSLPSGITCSSRLWQTMETNNVVLLQAGRSNNLPQENALASKTLVFLHLHPLVRTCVCVWVRSNLYLNASKTVKP